MRKGQSQAKASPSSGERANAHPLDMPEVEHFLTLLDGDADTFIFARGDDDKERRKRLIAEAKQSGRPPPGLWEHRRGSHVSTQPWLQEKQRDGWGVFVAVQAMRGAKCRLSDVAYIRCVFAEMDIGEPLKPYPLEPSMIIESSPGKYHVYWLVSPEEPINADEFNGIEMRLVETYGSDPDCKDRARRLRLPGTWNVKPGRPPHLVKLIHESGARYSKADLLEAFPPPRKRKPSSSKKRPLLGVPPRGLDRFVGQQKDGPLASISPDAYGDWLRVGMALHAETNGGADGLALWDGWSAQSEKWSPGACADKWKSFAGQRGITGGTIFAMAEESGWTRPIRLMNTAPVVVQKIHGAAQARRHKSAQSEASTRSSDAPAGDIVGAVNVELGQFHAHMPSGEFIFTPTRDLWPVVSVDARVPPVNTGEIDDSGKPKMIKASQWIRQNRPVEQMTWAPGMPQLIENAIVTDGGFIREQGRRVFNLYRPPTIKHGDPQLARKWLDHIERVYPSDSQHLINWLAQRVQRPDLKINHGLVLGGAPGIGKDTLLYPVVQAIGPWNMTEVSPSALMGSFNGYVKSVILRVSEAHDLGDVDRYALYERTKILQAAPPEVLRINEKHLREFTVPNVTGVVYTTNHRTDSLYLPPDDRRHYVAWSELIKDSFSVAYWSDLYDWYDRHGGCQHVAAYLATLNLDGFSRTAPPEKTEAFWAIAHADRSADDADLADAIDKLNKPLALTIAMVAGMAEAGLGEWLRDRKNARAVGHKLEKASYVAVSSDAQDGYWVVNGRRVRVYAHRGLGPAQRKTVAALMARSNGQLAELTRWAAENGVCL